MLSAAWLPAVGSLLVVGIHPAVGTHPVAGSPAVGILHEGPLFVRELIGGPRSDVPPALLSYAVQYSSKQEKLCALRM